MGTSTKSLYFKRLSLELHNFCLYLFAWISPGYFQHMHVAVPTYIRVLFIRKKEAVLVRRKEPLRWIDHQQCLCSHTSSSNIKYLSNCRIFIVTKTLEIIKANIAFSFYKQGHRRPEILGFPCRVREQRNGKHNPCITWSRYYISYLTACARM